MTNKSPLFSTYRQGENRVTSSMLAVFERIDVGLVERVMAAASGEASLSIVQFANQVSGVGGTVPDAAITASCRYLFEVKTVRGGVTQCQLQGHLKYLDGSHRQEYLFVVTPDTNEPVAVAAVRPAKIVWFNFLTLSQAIESLLNDPAELLAEQTRFLLRELLGLFAVEGLLGDDADTVVVPARFAWPEYLEYEAYVCQPGRAFRDSIERMGFYADGVIQPRIPTILLHRPDVGFTRENAQAFSASPQPAERDLGALITRMLDKGVRDEGESYQVFLLSGAEDERTLVLTSPIRNVSVDRNGRTVAWTQNQRYTRSQVLARGPRTTNDLEERRG